MPTVGERLATIEAGLKDLRHDFNDLHDEVYGGPTVEWKRSVKGRLHHIEPALAALVLRRKFGLGMAKGWQSAVLLLCAIGTAAAAWYSVLHG